MTAPDLTEARDLAAMWQARAEAAEAIIRGRTVPPSAAEIDAHAEQDNGGAWLVNGESATIWRDGRTYVSVGDFVYGEENSGDGQMWVESRGIDGAMWIPLLNGRPCAWPVAP